MITDGELKIREELAKLGHTLSGAAALEFITEIRRLRSECDDMKKAHAVSVSIADGAEAGMEVSEKGHVAAVEQAEDLTLEVKRLRDELDIVGSLLFTHLAIGRAERAEEQAQTIRDLTREAEKWMQYGKEWNRRWKEHDCESHKEIQRLEKEAKTAMVRVKELEESCSAMRDEWQHMKYERNCAQERDEALAKLDGSTQLREGSGLCRCKGAGCSNCYDDSPEHPREVFPGEDDRI